MDDAGNIALPVAFNILDKWGSSLAEQIVLLGFRDLTGLTEAKRKPEAALLSKDTLERMSYIFNIYGSLVALFGQENLGRNWMNTPQEIFGDESPIKHVQTKDGAREVKELLERIGYGVFS